MIERSRRRIFWLITLSAVLGALVTKYALSASRHPATDLRTRIAKDESPEQLRASVAWHAAHALGALEPAFLELPLESLPALRELMTANDSLEASMPCTRIRAEFHDSAWWGPARPGALPLRVSPYRYTVRSISSPIPIESARFPALELTVDVDAAGSSAVMDRIRGVTTVAEVPPPSSSLRVRFWRGKQGIYPSLPRLCAEGLAPLAE